MEASRVALKRTIDQRSSGLRARIIGIYSILILATLAVWFWAELAWAFVEPIRRLYYNLIITSASVVVAVLIGGIEALRLAGDQLGRSGWFWAAIGALNGNFNNLGFAVIGFFIVAWVGSMLMYRYGVLDTREIRVNRN